MKFLWCLFLIVAAASGDSFAGNRNIQNADTELNKRL